MKVHLVSQEIFFYFLVFQEEIVPTLLLFCVLEQIQKEVQSLLFYFLSKAEAICSYLDGVELVDAWPEVIWISPECDFKQRQEAVHPCQQTLRPVEAERRGDRRGDSVQTTPRRGFLGSYVLAKVSLEGMPSNTMTLSAR